MKINLIKSYGLDEIRGPWKHKRICDRFRFILMRRAIDKDILAKVLEDTRKSIIEAIFAPNPFYKRLIDGGKEIRVPIPTDSTR